MILSPYDWKCLSRYPGPGRDRVYQCRCCGERMRLAPENLQGAVEAHYQHRPSCEQAALNIPGVFPYRFVLWGGRERLHRDPLDLKKRRPSCSAEKWPWER